MSHQYKKIIIELSLIFSCFLYGEVFDGYTFFTPYTSTQEGATTLLIDNEFNTINSWSHAYGPSSTPYLLPDSSIIYPFRVPFPSMVAGGVGGGIQKQTWNGEIVWEYIFSDSIYQHHHDIDPLPNGNILIIVWEKKYAQEAYDMGRQTISNALNQMWSTAILELNPENGEIVWEWHLWDHLIQDIDPNLNNYGIISENPQLFDINCGTVGADHGGPQGANGDWMHINSIDYNVDLDQIVISSRGQDEIFIIDHSTTSEEASTHSGGIYGKGGDFLYRWGNPANYNQGDDSEQILNDQHSVNWIPLDSPGGGNLILFNNFHEDNTSAVLEFTVDYMIPNDGFFGPDTLEWYYTGDISTPIQGGAFRLPNGNTLITQTHTAKIIEVNSLGNIVWEYNSPNSGNIWIARAKKYDLNYLNNQLEGDLNTDGSINILDIVLLANLILTGDIANENADINQDGNQNILDIVTLVQLILQS